MADIYRYINNSNNVITVGAYTAPAWGYLQSATKITEFSKLLSPTFIETLNGKVTSIDEIPNHNFPQLVGIARDVDLTSTGDIQFTKVGTGTKFVPVGTEFLVILKSGSTTGSPISFSIYTSTGRTGSGVVVNSAALASMVLDSVPFRGTQNTPASFILNSMPYISFNTPNNQAATADFYLFGIYLD